MTIDERLDRLTERHEALSQSVEALVHAQSETGERLDQLIAAQQAAYGNLKSFIDVSTDAAMVNGRILNRLETKVEDHDRQFATLPSLAVRQNQFLEQHEAVMRGIDERLAKLTDLILKGYSGNGGKQ